MSRVIVVANNKGGIGKTTTATNLATGLVRKGKRVLAIDNIQQVAVYTSFWSFLREGMVDPCGHKAQE